MLWQMVVFFLDGKKFVFGRIPMRVFRCEKNHLQKHYASPIVQLVMAELHLPKRGGGIFGVIIIGNNIKHPLRAVFGGGFNILNLQIK